MISRKTRIFDIKRISDERDETFKNFLGGSFDEKESKIYEIINNKIFDDNYNTLKEFTYLSDDKLFEFALNDAYRSVNDMIYSASKQSIKTAGDLKIIMSKHGFFDLNKSKIKFPNQKNLEFMYPSKKVDDSDRKEVFLYKLYMESLTIFIESIKINEAILSKLMKTQIKVPKFGDIIHEGEEIVLSVKYSGKEDDILYPSNFEYVQTTKNLYTGIKLIIFLLCYYTDNNFIERYGENDQIGV